MVLNNFLDKTKMLHRICRLLLYLSHFLYVMKFRIGDQVMVTTGKDKGKQGTIARIFPRRNLVQIEGINRKVKHMKARGGNPGERIDFFAPIEISNIAIVDPETKKASRIGYKVDKNGNKTRISKSSGKELTSVKPAKTTVAA